jgi:cytochrome c peroxidase
MAAMEKAPGRHVNPVACDVAHMRLQLLAAAALLLLLTMLAQPSAAQEEPLVPLPASLDVDPARADIGHQLFNDKRLSANTKVSCASCHDLARGGADSRTFSLGLHGEKTGTNAPSVLNAALNFSQFWNGRAGSLEGQIDEVVQSPVEMGSKWPGVIAMVSRDANYASAFAAAYPGGVTKANIENALASYERTLITPDSRFDRYLRGNRNALTPLERTGYARFKQYGCVACHQGKNIGGNMYQKFGIMADYFADRGHQSKTDQGRFTVTGREDDRHVFKVPSLRNVALTAPYFHDGSAATLDAAVDVMFRYQLGRIAPAQDKAAIVAFLRTLTGKSGARP